MKILISLIGEQPIPNLLPHLYLKPDKSIILYTNRTVTVANRLSKIITNTSKIKIDAYNINPVFKKLETSITAEDNYIFNITGGTKLMSIALFQFAIQNNSEIVYLQSENNRSLLHIFYTKKNSNIETEKIKIPELISLDLYLKAHLPGYFIERNIENTFGIEYENTIVNALQKNNFEVLQSVKPNGEGKQIEIDAVIRLKGTNNVAIAEIKIGDANMERPKKGIDQLSTAGSREYLGIYTKRFLITRRKVNNRIYKLAKAHNIIVVDKITTDRNNLLYKNSEGKLIRTLTNYLK